MIIGLTGRSGSGKTRVSNYYRSKGFIVADCDKIAREITNANTPCTAKLAEVFGDDILSDDGTLLRHVLAQRAFSTKKFNQLLTEITHPFITQELLSQAEVAKQDGQSLFFADGALIIGYDFEQYCDKMIVVISNRRLAISRILLRDGISKQAVQQRLDAQKEESEMISKADYIIENNGTLSQLEHQAEDILQNLLKNIK